MEEARTFTTFIQNSSSSEAESDSIVTRSPPISGDDTAGDVTGDGSIRVVLAYTIIGIIGKIRVSVMFCTYMRYMTLCFYYGPSDCECL